jgi:uncharacterized protein YggE
MNAIGRTTLAVLLLVTAMSGPLWAGREQARRTIQVSGAGEARLMPDEVIITLKVVTNGRDLEKAVAENDEKVAKALDAFRTGGVKESDIRTGRISVKPQSNTPRPYNQCCPSDVFTVYSVEKMIAVRVKDLNKYDHILREVMQVAGAVHETILRSTKLRESRAKARALAMKAAKQKAEALAGQLGQKVGRPISIRDSRISEQLVLPGDLSLQPPHSRRGYSGRSVKLASSEGFAPDEICVTATISVTFELE